MKAGLTSVPRRSLNLRENLRCALACSLMMISLLWEHIGQGDPNVKHGLLQPNGSRFGPFALPEVRVLGGNERDQEVGG